MFSFDVFTILTTLIENAILFSKRIFSLPIFILLFNSSPSGEEFIVPCSMFIVNCASQSEAQPPLLPKLRGQFAEFLNNSSPVGLRILFLPTCVGLRYGRRGYSQNFSRPNLNPLRYSCISLPYARVDQRPGWASMKCPFA